MKELDDLIAKVQADYEATPEEIGTIRKEIRRALYDERNGRPFAVNPFLKAGTLNAHCWIWLQQRMRPAEREMLAKMTGRPLLDESPLVIGERRNLAEMPEDEARAVFGDAFYESWMATRNLPTRHGTVTVTSIDRSTSTITVAKK